MTDPTEALRLLGIPVEWDVQLHWFSAGLGLPDADADFQLRCVPEQLHHKVAKWLNHEEVEVGDPAFDKNVFVRTSDPDRAAKILANEGVQSALLAFLTDVRLNELASNHVTLEGPTLTVASRPNREMTEERIQMLKLEVAALAVHLSRRPQRAS